MKPVEIGRFLVVDPRVCHGKMAFKGTRLPVETVLYWLGKGKSIESILADWPYLSREAILEAVHLAAAALEDLYTKRNRTHEPNHPRRATRRKRSARSPSEVV